MVSAVSWIWVESEQSCSNVSILETFSVDKPGYKNPRACLDVAHAERNGAQGDRLVRLRGAEASGGGQVASAEEDTPDGISVVQDEEATEQVLYGCELGPAEVYVVQDRIGTELFRV